MDDYSTSREYPEYSDAGYFVSDKVSDERREGVY